jgi:hypothetical protein
MPDQLETRSARYERQETLMPPHVSEPTPFLVWEGLKISIGQAVTLVFGFFLWWIAASMTNGVLPLHGLFGWLIWAWLPVAAIALAFLRRDGVTLEKYLADKLAHRISAGVYIPRDEAMAEHGELYELVLREDEEWR